MSRKHISVKSCLIIFSLVLFASGTMVYFGKYPGQDQQAESVSSSSLVSPAVLNNSRLRSYYFREYEAMHFGYQEGAPAMGRNYVENWIDQQIIYNAGIIALKLKSLKDNHELGTHLLKRLEKEPERRDIRLQTKRFLKNFREDTKDLRSKIDFMVSGLDSKPEDDMQNYSVEKESAGHRMNMVKSELIEAEKLIRNYFLEPTHTVEVRDLEENNMMIRLYRIEKILESLEKTDL